MSWALVAQIIKSKHGQSFGCVAFDYRGHGQTTAKGPQDLSNETLVSDALNVLKKALPTTSVPVIFAGHSVGGAVAVHTACAGQIPGLSGVVVVDVVEGTALAALPMMPLVIAKRPERFESLDSAIRWSIKSGTLRNESSAKISIPGQLKEGEDGGWVWRTDLLKTEAHWEEWYRGLSNKFLSLSVPKILIVAGRDRLDDLLTRAHVQGKFQFVVLNSVGHCIQEDSPESVAEALVTLAIRNRTLAAKLKKKT